jgi:GLPGLI family protein
MEKIKLTFLLTILNNLLLISQTTGTITYSFKTKITYETSKAGITVLQFTNDTTAFTFENAKPVKPIESTPNYVNIALTDSEGYPLVITHKNRKFYQKTDLYLKKKCVIEDTLKEITWLKTSESKEIKGFKTFKANAKFGGRDYTAWYCPSISLPYGPYKFYGLPGLIFEIYDSEMSVVFSLLELKLNNNAQNQTRQIMKNLTIGPDKVYTHDIYVSKQKEFIDKAKSMYSEFLPEGLKLDNQIEKRYLINF